MPFSPLVIVVVVVSVVAGDHRVVRMCAAPLVVIELIVVWIEVLTTLCTMLANRLTPLHLLLMIALAPVLASITPNGHTDTAATKTSLARRAAPLNNDVSCARWWPAVIG